MNILLVKSQLMLTGILFFSYLFVVAGLHKLRRPEYTRQVIQDYRLIPSHLTTFVAQLLPVIEIAVGAALLVPELRARAGLAALALMTLYTLAITVNLVRGRRKFDCGCDGKPYSQHLSSWLLLRNFLLVGAMAGLSRVDQGVALPVAGWINALMAAIFTGIIYQVFNQLILNKSLWAGEAKNG